MWHLYHFKGKDGKGLPSLNDMEIIRKEQSFSLTGPELKEAAQEWEHICRMQRIVKYMADFYDLPMAVNQMAEASSPNMAEFYNTYKIPFSCLVDYAYNREPEGLLDCPDQVFLFLSSLAQMYEQDESLEQESEEDAFRILFQERQTQLCPENVTQLVNLGVFIQNSPDMVIGDPSVPNEDQYLSFISNVAPGMWASAVQEIASQEQPSEQRVAFLLAKSSDCPYGFQQMVEQAFFWPRHSNGILTMNGAIGLFDRTYYQDSTLFGKPPLTTSGAEYWTQRCIDITLDYPYAGILPYGVISSSGEGEGCYDAYYLKNAEGKVVAVVVDFFLYGEMR